MIMRLFTAVAVLSIAASRGTTARHQAMGMCADSTRLTVEPAIPRPGAVFLVRLSGIASGTQLAGEIALQALHFVPDSVGGAVSFAAVPIEVDSSAVEISVRCTYGDIVDTLRARVQLGRANYPVERLRVIRRLPRASGGSPSGRATSRRPRT
jgi:hypothetical protein